MNDSYFCWLVGLIGDQYIEMNYQKLLDKLYRTVYIWELDYDKNRAVDGLYLRREFMDQGGFWNGCGVADQDCSVLEMMVALARRAEHDIMYDPEIGDRTGLWFWTMIENLHLDIYDDFHWFEDEVNRILDVFLHHKYEENGHGGAFPTQKVTHKVTHDLRKTDLWWQLNVYLEEHFPV